MRQNYGIEQLSSIDLSPTAGKIVFLYGDLGAGKTSFVSAQIKKMLGKTDGDITSPTYVYYNAYEQGIYHFDLYRLEDYESFVMIGWEEILDNAQGIIFIEWPQILEPYYVPDLKVYIEKTSDPNLREIRIEAGK
jgi:tRNA threonylcarbamoyladenosine biosynthesis protein TsaE